MIKIKFPIFCCFLLLDLCLLSGCTTSASQQITHSFPPKTTNPIQAKQKKLPPSLIQIIQRPDRLRVVLYSDVCFKPNGHLTGECSTQLVKAMKTMKQYGQGMIQVVGYTDDIYDSTTAKELSQHEADAVVAFLWSQGISSQRLIAIGGGDQNPIANNRCVKGSAANRRVELIIVK